MLQEGDGRGNRWPVKLAQPNVKILQLPSGSEETAQPARPDVIYLTLGKAFDGAAG
jgi:hypothetical protein